MTTLIVAMVTVTVLLLADLVRLWVRDRRQYWQDRRDYAVRLRDSIDNTHNTGGPHA